MKITKLTSRQATIKTLRELKDVLGQLSEGKRHGTLAELKRILGNPTIAMMVVKDGARIIGVGTLYTMQKMSKRVSTVEDVVVDEAYRGQGFGEKLMRALIAEARARGVASIDLTSRPTRVAANRLYQKLGFEIRDTNYYRLKF